MIFGVKEVAEKPISAFGRDDTRVPPADGSR